MNRVVGFSSLLALLAIVIVLASGSPASAAANQPFFQGFWRCASGGTLNVTPSFGPWLSYRSTSGSNVAQAYFYHDMSGGGWVSTGIDSTGGYWTMTSTGWKDSDLTFNGTYTNNARTESQRQIFTRNANNAVTIRTWRNDSLVGHVGCNK